MSYLGDSIIRVHLDSDADARDIERVLDLMRTPRSFGPAIWTDGYAEIRGTASALMSVSRFILRTGSALSAIGYAIEDAVLIAETRAQLATVEAETAQMRATLARIGGAR